MTPDDVDDNEWYEKVSLAWRGGFGSVFGDGNELRLDLCQHCAQAVLGAWIKVVDPEAEVGSREEFDEHGLPVSPEAFEAFRAALDAPPVPNERLGRLMSRVPDWRAAAERLAKLGGSDPGAEAAPRRRPSETAHLLRSPANAEHLQRSITALPADSVRAYNEFVEQNGLPLEGLSDASESALLPPPALRARRLAQVLRLVWESDKDAAAWLTTEHPELGGRTPLEAARSESGARRVEQILLRIFFGIPG